MKMAAELVEAMNMVKSFRVSDLQTLLASMGRSKSGLKQDLVGRALRLVQTEYSPELLKNVRQLYESRFPKASGWLAARRPEGGVPLAYARSASPAAANANALGTDYLNGIPKPSPTPAAEVKLVKLPFYQTLETLMPPTELSESPRALRFDPESEIATTGLRVSLICPLVKMRLGVPCRVLTCAHLQCFDAVFFLQMNEKKPTWTCPVCDKPAPFELLTIDGLLSEILKETEDVEEIEYLTDGSWRPIRDEKERDKERERSNTPDYPVLDICSSEANGLSPAHSSTSQTGKSGAGGAVATAGGAAGGGGGGGGGAVVDLTLDSSSEEEDGGGPAGDSEDTEDSQDSPPPKRGRYAYDKDLVTAY
ncbi:E3 SUMO-protein ligase PIAS4-A [Anguilla anguilla]|uniref:E3 SUMO-protein ligase PIAS4-A n=1 Tax=Anguilla anguilla TaxID=7936 RepID=UPI0015B20C9A|nr:E3 SUMO-protein ligase PIAS4-A [Anguilla anguilla]